MAATEFQLERLGDAYSAFLRDRTCAVIESRLFDACIEAGMDRDEPVASDWAAVQLFDWMVSPAEAA